MLACLLVNGKSLLLQPVDMSESLRWWYCLKSGRGLWQWGHARGPGEERSLHTEGNSIMEEKDSFHSSPVWVKHGIRRSLCWFQKIVVYRRDIWLEKEGASWNTDYGRISNNWGVQGKVRLRQDISILFENNLWLVWHVYCPSGGLSCP